MFDQPWLPYAIGSALAAALVGIFGKIGMKGVDSTLATALRSVVMTVFLLGLCLAVGEWRKASSVSAKSLTMITLSGLAGAVSWLLYFKALQVGEVSQVAPIDKLSMPLAVLLAVIVLKSDRPSAINWFGVALVTIGGFLAALPRSR